MHLAFIRIERKNYQYYRGLEGLTCRRSIAILLNLPGANEEFSLKTCEFA
jgi:hypothetical protein